jgi:hypothetical protein
MTAFPRSFCVEADQMLHEGGGDLEDELDLLLDHCVVVLDVAVLVIRIVLDQLDEHIAEFLGATALFDVRADEFDLVFKRLVVFEHAAQQLFQRQPQIVEQIAVERSVLELLQCRVVERERLRVTVQPVPRLLDQGFVDFGGGIVLRDAAVARDEAELQLLAFRTRNQGKRANGRKVP